MKSQTFNAAATCTILDEDATAINIVCDILNAALAKLKDSGLSRREIAKLELDRAKKVLETISYSVKRGAQKLTPGGEADWIAKRRKTDQAKQTYKATTVLSDFDKENATDNQLSIYETKRKLHRARAVLWRPLSRESSSVLLFTVSERRGRLLSLL